MTTLILALGGNKLPHNDVRDNNAFFSELMSTLKAIKSYCERSYDEQNITLVVSFDNFPMK